MARVAQTPELVTVCQNDDKSAEASQLLRAKGFEHVSPMRGGILLWMQKGYPVKDKRFELAGEVRPNAVRLDRER